MATMGYNIIRLGVLWAGLEPEEGQYNMTYLDQVIACVNNAEKGPKDRRGPRKCSTPAGSRELNAKCPPSTGSQGANKAFDS